MKDDILESQINSSGINTNASNYLSSTMPGFTRKRNEELFNRLTKFEGFYNKKFNLTSYQKMRENSRSRSKSPERIYLPTKKKGNGIPNDIIPRIKYLKDLVHEKRFQNYYNECPKKKDSNLQVISDYICKYKGKHSELDTYLMIFYYICQNIKYDYKGYELNKNNKFDQSAEKVFLTGNGLSIGFCNLFEYFCKKKNLKYRRIEGYTRLLPPIKGQKDKFNHIWHSIFVKGEWYFIDIVFGSGGILDVPYEFSKPENDYFNPYYFLIFPEYLIMTHLPLEDDWQKTEKLMTEKQFFNKKLINFGNFYKGFYDYDILLLSHDYPFIIVNKDEDLIIKIKVNDSVVQGDLYHSNGKDKLGEVKYTYDDDSKIFTLEPSFPYKGEFVLIILFRSNSSSDLLYHPVLEYKIKYCDDRFLRLLDKYKINNNNQVRIRERPQTESLELPKIRGRNYMIQPKIIPDYNKIFPNKNNKKICFDNDNTHIIEPKTTILRKGFEYKFKIRARGTSNVAVLDGRKFNYLKKIDMETYEGQFIILSDNVCICSLRSANVFTEIFRFRVHTDSSYLLKRMIKNKK